MTYASTSPPAVDSRADSSVVDSLLHPQAVLIRRLLNLTPSERSELGSLIIIDDAENIVQAIRAGLTIHSLFHSNDAVGV